MNPHARVERIEGLPFTKLEGQLLVVVAKTREVHLLNESAARLWELLETASTLEALLDRLREEYEMDAATARLEVEAAISDMAEKGLVRIHPA